MTRALWLLALVALVSFVGSATAAPVSASKAASKQAAKAAGAHFTAGQRLYGAGKFAAALARFEAAQKLAPHRATLFNIARCQENLGRSGEALRAYREALALTRDPRRRANTEARIKRLERKPGRIFVTSSPAGAFVDVDGARQRARTPTLLRLAPGPHVLVLRREGHGLQVRRVVVEAGRERTLSVFLPRLAAGKVVPCKPKRVIVHAPAPALARFEGLRLHAGVGFALFNARGWGGLAGPDLQFGLAIGRFVLSLHLNVLPVSRDLPDSLSTSVPWLGIATLQAGWAIPFSNFFVVFGGALGGYIDRVEEAKGIGKSGDTQDFKGVTWGGVAELHAMVTEWLALGVGVRAGMMHGNRLDDTLSKDSRHHFPYATLWSSLTFHFGG